MPLETTNMGLYFLHTQHVLFLWTNTAFLEVFDIVL